MTMESKEDVMPVVATLSLLAQEFRIDTNPDDEVDQKTGLFIIDGFRSSGSTEAVNNRFNDGKTKWHERMYPEALMQLVAAQRGQPGNNERRLKALAKNFYRPCPTAESSGGLSDQVCAYTIVLAPFGEVPTTTQMLESMQRDGYALEIDLRPEHLMSASQRKTNPKNQPMPMLLEHVGILQYETKGLNYPSRMSLLVTRDGQNWTSVTKPDKVLCNCDDTDRPQGVLLDKNTKVSFDPTSSLPALCYCEPSRAPWFNRLAGIDPDAIRNEINGIPETIENNKVVLVDMKDSTNFVTWMTGHFHTYLFAKYVDAAAKGEIKELSMPLFESSRAPVLRKALLNLLDCLVNLGGHKNIIDVQHGCKLKLTIGQRNGRFLTKLMQDRKQNSEREMVDDIDRANEKVFFQCQIVAHLRAFRQQQPQMGARVVLQGASVADSSELDVIENVLDS